MLTNSSGSPPRGTSIVSTIESALASVDSNTNRLGKSLIESETQRAKLQEELLVARRHLDHMSMRAQASEDSLASLTAEHQALKQAHSRLTDEHDLQAKEHNRLQERHQETSSLLRSFEGKYDLSELEWRRSLELAESEAASLRRHQATFSAKAVLSDELKSKCFELEKQLRTRDSDAHELSARVRILEHKLEHSDLELRTNKNEVESIRVQLATCERETRVSQHTLLSEQFRVKQLQSLVDLYRRRSAGVLDVDGGVRCSSSTAAQKSQDDVAAVIEERDILKDDVNRMVGQLAILQVELKDSQSKYADASSRAAQLQADLRECEEARQEAYTRLRLHHNTSPHRLDAFTSSPSSGRANTTTASVVGTGSTASMQVLELQHANTILKRSVAERDESFHQAKTASVELSMQIEALSLKLRGALEKQHEAEAVANGCRRQMTEAQTALLVANYKETGHAECQSHTDNMLVSVMRSLAHSESLAQNSTAEVERWRSKAFVEADGRQKALEDLDDMRGAKEHLTHELLKSRQTVASMSATLTSALESRDRLQVELDASYALGQCLMERTIDVSEALRSEQMLALSTNLTFGRCSSRLQTLVGDHHNEPTLDDIAQYLQTSAALLKEVVITTEEVARAPPTLYQSLVLRAGIGGYDATTSHKIYASLFGDGVGGPSGAAHSNNMQARRELLLLELAMRNHLIAEEVKEWCAVGSWTSSFFATCADYQSQIQHLNRQLHVVSEHSANLFRAVKVFSSRQVRKFRVGAQYRELEASHRRLWEHNHELRMIHWDVVNDVRVSIANRRDIRAKLEALPEIDLASSILTGASTSDSAHASVGEMVAQLKLENDRLLEETGRIAKHLVDAEARNTSYLERITTLEHERDDPLLWTERPTNTLSSMYDSGRYDSARDDDLQAIEAALTTLTITQHRSDAIVAHHDDILRKVLAFSEGRLVDIHNIATRNVYDICVASSFLLLLRGGGGGGGGATTKRLEVADAPDSDPVQQLLQVALRTSTSTSSDHFDSAKETNDVDTQTDMVAESPPPPSRFIETIEAPSTPLQIRTASRLALMHTEDVFSRIQRDEELTRALLKEHASSVLVGLLHRVVEQAVWYSQLEQQRHVAELNQSHNMHLSSVQVTHKQQCLAYATAVDECNQRLVSVMKAKSATDQDGVRLRAELRRAMEDTSVAKKSVVAHEESANELQLRLVDSEERCRLLTRERDQLVVRLTSVTEQNRLLAHPLGLVRQTGAVEVDKARTSYSVAVQTEQSARSLLAVSSPFSFTNSSPSGTPPPAPHLDPQSVRRNHHSQPISGAASMFSPYMQSILGGTDKEFDTSAAARGKHPSASHGDHLAIAHASPPAALVKLGKPSLIQSTYDRGYQSLEEWDAVLQAKAEAFLHKEVEWSVRERQLLALERELDLRVKETARDCAHLKYSLQERQQQLYVVIRVVRCLLRSRRERQQHLAAHEIYWMTENDPLRSASPAVTAKSAQAFVHAAVQTVEDAPALPLPTHAADDHGLHGGGWWTATKSVFHRK